MKRCLIAIAAAALLTLAACDAEQIAQTRDQLHALRTQTEQVRAAVHDVTSQREALTDLVRKLPEGDRRDRALALIDRTSEYLEQGESWLDDASAVMADLEARLADQTDLLGAAEATITTLAPIAPQPWGAIAAGVAGLAIGLLRSWQSRDAAKRIVQAIEQVKQNATVNFDDPDTQRRLTFEMGPAGKALVDAAQGKRSILPA